MEVSMSVQKSEELALAAYIESNVEPGGRNGNDLNTLAYLIRHSTLDSEGRLYARRIRLNDIAEACGQSGRSHPGLDQLLGRLIDAGMIEETDRDGRRPSSYIVLPGYVFDGEEELDLRNANKVFAGNKEDGQLVKNNGRGYTGTCRLSDGKMKRKEFTGDSLHAVKSEYEAWCSGIRETDAMADVEEAGMGKAEVKGAEDALSMVYVIVDGDGVPVIDEACTNRAMAERMAKVYSRVAEHLGGAGCASYRCIALTVDGEGWE